MVKHSYEVPTAMGPALHTHVYETLFDFSPGAYVAKCYACISL